MKVLTRTEAVEMAHEQIERAVRAAIALDTGRRAYNDIAVWLEQRPTQSEIADECVAEVAAFARKMADQCSGWADAKRATAETLRAGVQ